MADLWFKNSIIYCLDVDTFADGNGDGVGDFEGLTAKLDYLSGLHVDCVWLQPFYPSPNRDNGYDITDYYTVDHRLGTLGDFTDFSRKAHERGMRVMIDLVVNHTSIDHPWFQVARKAPDSKYRDYYVWADERPPDADQGMVFPGEQETTWTWDDEANAYYFHRFYKHQPELNILNPDVRQEIAKIIGFWVQLGVSGFRVDALPFLLELKGIEGAEGKDPYEYLHEMRHHLSWLRGDAIIMAEANLTPDEVPDYFSDGDRIHMSFNFFANQYMFLSFARESAAPLRQAMDKIPPLPRICQWAYFLRSHDELDLGRLSDEERQEVFQAFGPDPDMQIFDRGIRRRLAPMLNNDRRRIELAHSLMLTLPGTPCMRFGDEIGMGDDLALEGRKSVRNPMQWSSAKNGGFSSADAKKEMVLPMISGGDYGFEKVNVAAQEKDPKSLLNWVEHAVRTRRRCPEFGSGDFEWLDTGNDAVLAHRAKMDNASSCVALHNFSSQPVTVEFPLGENVACLQDLLSEQPTPVETDGTQTVELPPYGFRWYREELKAALPKADRRPPRVILNDLP